MAFELPNSSESMHNYFTNMVDEVNTAFKIASEARKKMIDPETEVEISLAKNMAERVVGLISTVAPQIKGSKVVDRIHELEKMYGVLDWRVAFKIAEELAKQELCKFKDEKEAMEVGIRTGFAYITIGTVSSCLEGFTHLQIMDRRDKTGKYLCLFYSGPTRNAGGTAAACSVLIADYVRKKMGYAQYDPDEKEINRTFCEVEHYNDRCARVQYFPSKDELDFLTKNIPIQVSGEPTETIEVPNYKNLPRIHTNIIRGGFCLVMTECITQKAPKLWKQLSKWGHDFDMGQWDFMGELIDLQKKIKAKAKEAKESTNKSDKKEEKPKISPDYTFIADLVGGRPVFTHPLRTGGFRLRYGRSRASGLSGQSIHPSTMIVANEFIATGTQLKVERPGKAATYTSCESIEGPIVKLNNGNVIRVETEKKAREIKDEVKEIIFLGDILICYGDFFDRNHPLVPAGYCEEWWVQELERSIVNTFGSLDLEKTSDLCKIDIKLLEIINKDPLNFRLNYKDIYSLSDNLKVPLHPYFLFHWKDISNEDFDILVDHLHSAKMVFNGEDKSVVDKIIIPRDEKIKRSLECLGIPHIFATDYYVVENEDASALYSQLNDFNFEPIKNSSGKNPLERLNSVLKIILRDKSGTFIGARMGRPEKGKMRSMKGSPHGLFPVGEEGGRMRSMQSALTNGKVTSSFPLMKCEKCNYITIYSSCEKCNSQTKQLKHCHKCGIIDKECGHDFINSYSDRSIDFQHYFQDGLTLLGTTIYPDIIKGIKGTINKEHFLEHISKAILRAKHNVHVNKEGTVRYDATEVAVTHFKPREVGVSFEKLKRLGYTKDIYGGELVSDDQVLEIKCQDVILPCCKDIEHPADKVLLNTTKFIDELLEKVYKLPAFYKCKDRSDLVGHIIISLAPHTSAGTASRIIGFSKNQTLMAHPLLHCACRRDCVSYNTKFLLKDNKGDLNYNDIGGYVENLISSQRIVWNGRGTLKIKPKEELVVFGLDPKTNKLREKKVKYFMKNERPDYWIKIRTGTGREITMTDNHKFIYYENGRLNTKKASEILVGDRVPLLKKLKLEDNNIDKVNLIDILCDNLPERERSNVKIINGKYYFKELIRQNRKLVFEILELKSPKNLSRWYKEVPLVHFKKLIDSGIISYKELPKLKIKTNHNWTGFDFYLNINTDFAALIGYYLAEGHYRKNETVSQVCFRINNKEIQKRISILINNVFGITPSFGEDNSKITIGHKLIYYLFRYCLNIGKGAYEKRVPNLFYKSNREVVQSLVSAYFDGDGSVVPKRKTITFYSVSKSLLDDIALLLAKFGIFGRYSETDPRLPGKTIIEKYQKLSKSPKQHILHHLTYFGQDVYNLSRLIGSYVSYKKHNLLRINKNISQKRKTIFGGREYELIDFGDSIIDCVKSVEILDDDSPSYCLEIEWKDEVDKNILWGQQIINARCDGDEIGFFLLMDGFLNFSKKFLPQSRGGTMDAPLVLTSVIDPTGVDDMIFNMDTVWKYPLELYESALEYKMPFEVKIEKVKERLGSPGQYEGYGFTHDNIDFNAGVFISAYKTLPTMQDKLLSQMDVAAKIRAVDTSDVASLVINKHFLKDTKGNLRKFSQQQFRCVNCNTKYRRPPLSGKCSKCSNGKLIFTISEGSVIKYLQLSIDIAQKHDVPVYVKQCLEIVKLRVDSYFGRETEKQEGLKKWFGEV